MNESVKLTKALGKASAAGMVNAVLRRAASAKVCESEFADPLDRLATYYCLSRPVAQLFYEQFGEEAFPLAAAFYDKPKTTIRVNTLRTNDAALTALLQSEGHTVTPGPWAGALVIEFAGSPPQARPLKKGFSMYRALPASLPRCVWMPNPASRCLTSALRRAAKA